MFTTDSFKAYLISSPFQTPKRALLPGQDPNSTRNSTLPSLSFEMLISPMTLLRQTKNTKQKHGWLTHYGDCEEVPARPRRQWGAGRME